MQLRASEGPRAWIGASARRIMRGAAKMFIVRMNSGAHRSAGWSGTERSVSFGGTNRRVMAWSFVKGVDTRGTPRLEASLQAGLIRTSASLVSSPRSPHRNTEREEVCHRRCCDYPESRENGLTPWLVTSSRTRWGTSFKRCRFDRKSKL